MRILIERIASENNNENCNIAFIKNKNKKFINRERSCSTSSNKYEKNISTKTNTNAQVSDISAKGDSEFEDVDGYKGTSDNDIKFYESRSINIIKPDHFDICLQYWQDSIYPIIYKA